MVGQERAWEGVLNQRECRRWIVVEDMEKEMRRRMRCSLKRGQDMRDGRAEGS